MVVPPPGAPSVDGHTMCDGFKMRPPDSINAGIRRRMDASRRAAGWSTKRGDAGWGTKWFLARACCARILPPAPTRMVRWANGVIRRLKDREFFARRS